MASPLAPFANARLLWTAKGSRSSGRDGYKVTPGQAYLIQAFLKRESTPYKLTKRMQLPAVNGMKAQFAGYSISFAEVTAEQAENFATIDLSTLTFDESMLLPEGVKRDDTAKLFIPGLETLDVRFSDKATVFGDEGIGGIIRGVLGDQIFLEGGQQG